jgi:hypothetical protein
MILGSRWEDNHFSSEWEQAWPKFSMLLILSRMKFFVAVVSKFVNCAEFSKDLLAVLVWQFFALFLWQDSKVYLVLTAFTSTPTPY